MLRRTAILFSLVALGACSQGRKLENVEETASNSACTRCHGGTDNDTGAPPTSMRGAIATTDPGVGAHSAHVEAGAVAGAFPCTTCHPDPRSGSTAHGNGRIDVAFGGVAASAPGAAAPRYVPETGTCSSVYCHGAFHGGNDANAPVWTNVGSGAGGCGTCHGVPPPSPHPVVSDLTRCNVCHSESIDATGNVLGANMGGKHLDGQVQSSGHGADWMNPASDRFHAFAANADLLSCSECHGADLSGGQVGIGCGQCHDANLPAGVASWKVNCVMCHGGTDNGTGAPPRTIRGQSGDTVRIGAHTKHVSGGALASAFGCEVCHPKPSDALTPGHVNGTRADVAFAAIAVQGIPVSPSWDPASRSCATYCHGATLSAGGSNTAPDWTGGSSEATCGSCHGAPPPFPHPQSTDCARCHTGTVLASGAIDLAGGKHVDGTVQVDGGGCTACHGTEGVNPAPPAGTNGETLTTQRAVGAHQKHVVTGTIRSAFACSACHATVSDVTHVNGAISLPFTGLASQGTTPAWNGATCASTYCHGATLGAGGSNTAPTWTSVSAGPTGCGSCHGAPPPFPHPPSTDCARCHSDTVLATGAIDLTGGKHIDGTLQVTGGGCTACHGTEGVNPAPPFGTNGETLTSQRAVGAHQKHVVNGPILNALACEACHASVTDLAHVNGTISMPFAGLASKGTTPSWTGTTCSSTYCHGSTLNAGGSNPNPTWTAVSAGPTSCGSCHGAPPPLPHPQNADCYRCHKGTVLATGAIDVAGGKHIDGTTTSGGCTGCHGTEGVNAAPPFGTNGETLTTQRAVGAHQAHLGSSGLPPVVCTECHVVPTSSAHSDGSVQLTFGPLSRAGGATPTWNARTLTCSNVACHSIPTGTYSYIDDWDYSTDTPIWKTVPYGGGAAVETPSWTSTGLSCSGCHGNPPRDYGYTWHSGYHGGGNECELCHPDAVSSGGVATGLNTAMNCGPNKDQSCAAYHANGTLDVTPQWRTSCYNCH